MSKILVVDNDSTVRFSLNAVLSSRGFVCHEAVSAEEAIRLIETMEFDAAITDIEMPGMSGLMLLDAAARIQPRLAFIVMTAYASVETAIEALRKGAYDYLLKPVNFQALAIKVQKLLEHKELVVENQALRQEIHDQYNFSNIIGQSTAIKQVFAVIKKVAASDSNVLITGNSGTGKELAARAIHFNSSRSRGRFVAINCGAIQETLFESELFGHKRGSFTGAVADQEGLFRAADQGSLFLDEISEMSLTMQAKLLRAIETRRVTPVGATESVQTDVRILAASNRDLADCVNRGLFREDLYYRLNVIEIKLPSLNQRREDIPLLVHHFIEKYNRQMNKKIQGVEAKLLHVLMQREWKGEVRELENFIERLMILCEGPLLTVDNLPAESKSSAPSHGKPGQASTLKQAVAVFERDFIIEQLRKNHYHRGETSRALGIGEATLYRKISELGIDLKEEEATRR